MMIAAWDVLRRSGKGAGMQTEEITGSAERANGVPKVASL
jgi:hypothetical protein